MPGTMTSDMFVGLVPLPRLMYRLESKWPWNQPGSKATAPPWTGHLVRFVERGNPPPARAEVST